MVLDFESDGQSHEMCLYEISYAHVYFDVKWYGGEFFKW